MSVSVLNAPSSAESLDWPSPRQVDQQAGDEEFAESESSNYAANPSSWQHRKLTLTLTRAIIAKLFRKNQYSFSDHVRLAIELVII